MKSHIFCKANSLQKLYKNRIPIYRLNKPKIGINEIKNVASQRFTYNQKLNKFTEDTNKTTQDVFDYELNQTFTKIKLRKKKNVSISKHHKNQAIQQIPFSIDKVKMRSSRKQRIQNDLIEVRNQILNTEFDINFLRDYSKQNVKIKQRAKRPRFLQNSKQTFFLSSLSSKSNKKSHFSSQFSKNQTNLIHHQNSSKLLDDMKQINLQNAKNQQIRKQIKRHSKIDEEINKFFQFFSALQKLQYTQQKIDQWISNYILTQKTILKDIFLKEKGFNRISSTEIQYSIEDREQIKIKAKQFKRIINFKEVGLQLDDLKDLNTYIENILIQKQYFQLKRIEDYIKQKSKLIQTNYEDLKAQKSLEIKKAIDKYFNGKNLQPLEYYQTYNFFEDVKLFQDLYGQIKGVNRSSRRIFQDLTQIQLSKTMKK